MIINSIFSFIFVWSLRQYRYRFIQLQKIRKNIASLPIDSVSQVYRKLQTLQPGNKIFLIVKGLVKLRVKLRGQRSIYSIINLKQIRRFRLSEDLLKKNWESLAGSAVWKQHDNFQNLEFILSDQMNSNKQILVNNCKQSALSGALNQIFQDRNLRQPSSNIFIQTLSKFYNFLANRAPFCYIFPPSAIGEQLALYGVQDGQFSLVIGDFQKDAGGAIICKSPNFVTKQRSYVQMKIWKLQKKLALICFLLASLLVILGIKFLRKIYEQFKKWRLLRDREQDQARSESQGDNCNCIICYEKVRNIVFKPCLHYAVCKSCFKLMQRRSCPYCKQNIEDTIDIIKRK